MASTREMSYKAVAQLHKPLADLEFKALIDRLFRLLATYEHHLLMNKQARGELYHIYNERLAQGFTVCQLSRNFNTFQKGASKKQEQEIEALMKMAHESESNSLPPFGIRNILANKLSWKYLFKAEVRKHSPRAEEVYVWIVADRERLFHSVIKMAADIAARYRHNSVGEVLELEDFLNEAIIGALAGVEGYIPNGPDDKSFTTYVYECIKGSLSKFEAENSRTVRLPRYLIDRWGPVGEALGVLGGGTYEDIAKLSTKILHDKRQKTRGKKLRREEVYSPEEVFKLILATQDAMSLNLSVGDDGRADGKVLGPTALEEILESKVTSQEEELDCASVNKKLTYILYEYCTPEQFAIMEIRWGMGDVLTMQETARIYAERTGKRITKSKVSEIEQTVFEMLRKDGRVEELFEVIR